MAVTMFPDRSADGPAARSMRAITSASSKPASETRSKGLSR